MSKHRKHPLYTNLFQLILKHNFVTKGLQSQKICNEPVNIFQNLQPLHTKRVFRNILSGRYLINSGSTDSIKRNIGFWMTCNRKDPVCPQYEVSVWRGRNGLPAPYSHPQCIYKDYWITQCINSDPHTTSIQPFIASLSGSLGLLDTTSNHIWHNLTQVW